MIFFLLHHLVHSLFGTRVSEERKNLFTFLFGTFLWVCLFTAVQDKNVRTKMGFMGNALGVGYCYLLIADVFAMAVIYKNYWGSTILRESNSVLNDVPLAHDMHALRDKKNALCDNAIRDINDKNGEHSVSHIVDSDAAPKTAAEGTDDLNESDTSSWQKEDDRPVVVTDETQNDDNEKSTE